MLTQRSRKYGNGSVTAASEGVDRFAYPPEQALHVPQFIEVTRPKAYE